MPNSDAYDLTGVFGQQRFTAQVMTDNQAFPLLGLTLAGEFTTTELATPVTISIGAFPPGATIDSTVRVPLDGIELSSLEVMDESNCGLIVHIEDTGDSKGQKRPVLRIEGNAPHRDGPFRVDCNACFGNSAVKKGIIVITGEVYHRFQYKVDTYAGAVQFGGKEVATISIRDRFTSKLSVDTIRSVDPFISAAWQAKTDGSVEVEFEVSHGGRPSGATSSTVEIVVDLSKGGQEQLSVTVHAFLLPEKAN